MSVVELLQAIRFGKMEELYALVVTDKNRAAIDRAYLQFVANKTLEPQKTQEHAELCAVEILNIVRGESF